jgi:hypothetical protein
MTRMRQSNTFEDRDVLRLINRPSAREAVARSEIEGRLSRGPSGNDEGRN